MEIGLSSYGVEEEVLFSQFDPVIGLVHGNVFLLKGSSLEDIACCSHSLLGQEVKSSLMVKDPLNSGHIGKGDTGHCA